MKTPRSRREDEKLVMKILDAWEAGGRSIDVAEFGKVYLTAYLHGAGVRNPTKFTQRL